jgi:enterochelin esterase-like enzyme
LYSISEVLETTHSLASASLGYAKSLWLLRSEPAAPATRLLVFTDAEIYLPRVGARDALRPFLDAPGASVCAVFVSHGSEEQRFAESLFSPQFSAFLGQELPTFLRNQNVIAPTAEAALCGLSLTGLATVVTALDQPGFYAKIGAQSGAYWPEDGRILRELDRLPRPNPPAFYFDVGSEETDREGEVMSQQEGVEAVRAKLEALGCAVKVHVFNGGHSTRGWRAALPLYLQWALAR